MLNIKPFQETLHAGMCGPASLKMVLEYYGVLKTENELAKLCNTDTDSGTNDVSIKRVAESFGFSVEIKNNSSFEDIKFWIDKKVPLIVD